ncbi:hypothetical protein PVAND_008379 [Polypedilum vanderplanki]|uniref:LanC-like protein 3 homolog n=1 Tax=Polypedilum vanderplanki TaxID=319348 RepID=A0A9J6CAE6_POLVA|nr:hypothetical protein PVAND_008379 [Polypedilum vanderplanki]
MRHFINPYPDYNGSGSYSGIEVDKIKSLIQSYVNKILQYKNYNDGDLYVGSSGIAFMFLKLSQSAATNTSFPSALQNAKMFIDHSKKYLSKKEPDKASLLCGNAGIFAVSAIINHAQNNARDYKEDIKNFVSGFEVCKKLNFCKFGSDEVLFGRAGYLSGVYWINQNLQERVLSAEQITQICDVIIESGVAYAQRHRLNIPMMWECYGDKYLGAAHGICAILHMLLESPLFAAEKLQHTLNQKQQLIKTCIDTYLQMQSSDGNFPSVLEDADKTEHKLVHWCHGAPGSVYLFAKAFLIFKEEKYLQVVVRAGDLIWNKGLLRKGPSICHGVAGNGYVFLLLYRLTNDQKHLYRASCFADFLTNEIFLREARTPDRPMSLYEGIAGTICFLIDLLQPENASFPFMDVFETKY